MLSFYALQNNAMISFGQITFSYEKVDPELYEIREIIIGLNWPKNYSLLKPNLFKKSIYVLKI